MPENQESAPKRKPGQPRKGNLVLDEPTIAAELAKSQGNISATAKRLNVTRSSIQYWVDRSPQLQRILQDSREAMLDDAETSLTKAIKKGEAWSVCFSLKTQGRSRGYSERTEDLPPLEVLLAAIRPDDAAVVRAALADAVQRRANPGGVPAPAGDPAAVRPPMDAGLPAALPDQPAQPPA